MHGMSLRALVPYQDKELVEQVNHMKAPRRASVRTRVKNAFPCPGYDVLLRAHRRFTKFVPETNNRMGAFHVFVQFRPMKYPGEAVFPANAP